MKGIYVSTVNSLPVLRALQERRALGSVTVVTTDLFPGARAVDPRRRGGGHLYQRPLTQGRVAVQALYRYLLDGTRPPARIKVMPHVVMRSNLELVLDGLASRRSS